MNVAFAVPFALDASLRFVRGLAELPGVRLTLISQESPDRIQRELGKKLAGFQRVEDALDPDQLEAAVRRAGAAVGGRIERLMGVLEQLQVPLAQVRQRLKIRGMDVREAQKFRDKALMKDALREAGIPCAGYALASTVPEAIVAARKIGYPLVVKPPAGAGALSTVRVENEGQLGGTLRALPPRADAPVLLEEFVTGREHSFDSVSVKGKHVFHSISRYYPTPLEVLESPWVQWCVVLPRDVSVPEFDAIHEVGPKALDALGMVTGLTHMEWFRRDDGSIAVSEVAARPPGAQFTSLLSWAHDLDFYRAWARLIIYEEFEPPARDWAVGAVFLRAQGDGRVSGVEGLQAVHDELGELVVDAKIPKAGQPTSGTYEGEGFVIVRHAETAVVEEACKRILESVRVTIG